MSGNRGPKKFIFSNTPRCTTTYVIPYNVIFKFVNIDGSSNIDMYINYNNNNNVDW